MGKKQLQTSFNLIFSYKDKKDSGPMSYQLKKPELYECVNVSHIHK